MTNNFLEPRERIRLEALLFEAQRRIERKRHKSLLAFIKDFWHVLEPQTKLVDGWPLQALCQHLEAITAGEITRILINVPPGFMKSLVTDVFWPAWEWGPMNLPHLRYVAFSYSSSLTERDNRRFGALVTSARYQELYGDRVQIKKLGDKIVSNAGTGWKLASSVSGVGTGERGDRIILDDPHNVKEAESELVRTETVRWFRESMSNRFNDIDNGAIVIIMQRVHEEDVSGVILSAGLDYVHLMIPMEYDVDRQVDEAGDPIPTEIGWTDPRYEMGKTLDDINGIPAWPERFGEQSTDRLKNDVGPYAWAGQYQQAPAPRGGGIFKRDWWQLFESPDGKFPVFEFMFASLDSAFTDKEQNDPSGLTVWGVWQNPDGLNRLMLVHAWRKHLQFSGPRLEIEVGETKQAWVGRTQKTWGLMEWLKYTCERFKVDRLLIEAKASGMSAAQELSNRYGDLDFAVQLCEVSGDKYARALAAQATFSQMMVYAPAREWAEMVIDEMAVFPKGKYKDLTDSTTQAIKYVRDSGLLRTDREHYADEREAITPRRRGPSVAQQYFG